MLLSAILSDGRSSRLYKRLVYDLEAVTAVEATVDQYIDPGLFTVYAQMRTGMSAEEVEQEIYRAIDSVAAYGVTERELEKAKNGAQVSYVSGFKTNSGIASRMGHYEVIWGGYAKAFEMTERLSAVSVNDIRRVAKEYLVPDRRTVVTLVPEQREEAE
ncbi:MAG: insulinase family protein, partial [Ignavibacteria bacterium]|nr:insulinase family protein [Ignavibacteria bacterium]